MQAERQTLKEFGEDRFVAWIKQQPWASGLGDDCSVEKTKSGWRLVTTDLLVEGVHFNRAWTNARQLGVKSLAVSLSDIAAMGGTPESAYVSIALPATTRVAWAKDLLRGILTIAAKHGVTVRGGDTTGSKHGVFISVTLTGRSSTRPKLRSGLRAGDVLCVTGRLGGSALALSQKQHLTPTPRVAAGQWLGRQAGVTAMMDLSDGLATDLPRLARASDVAIRVDAAAIPRSPSVSVDLAITGGEDYELVLGVKPRALGALITAYQRTSLGQLFPIGVCSAGSPHVRYQLDGRLYQPMARPFSHF